MPSFCCVVNCGSNAARDSHLSFFRIPSMYGADKKICELSRKRRAAWIAALKRDDLTESKIKYGRICSLHFHSGKPANLRDVNHPDWIPTKKMGYQTSRQVKNLERYERLKKRGNRKIASSAASNQVIDTDIEHTGTPASVFEESSSYTTQDTFQKPTYEELEFALQQANQEIYRLRDELKKYKLEEEVFKNSDEEVLYYTGFPEYIYVQNIFKTIEPYLSEKSSLSKFHQLLIVLIKLRLNFPFTYMAKIFQCHRTTISRTFEKVVNILYYRFKSFVYWPIEKDLLINIPSAFRNIYGEKTIIIIDCFEVFIEKPSNIEAAARTWSHYKSHHTMKFLIAISPQGCILFISKAYGGRASDKFITEDSGFLNNLCRGDLVIADRGFSIDNEVRLYCAEVQYPSFLKGKKQLGAEDLEKTRKLSSVRIHVERVIGLLKNKYKIFTGVFPLITLRKQTNEFAFIDHIIVLCCAFINLCPSVVSVD